MNKIIEKYTLAIIIICVLAMFAHYLVSFATTLSNLGNNLP